MEIHKTLQTHAYPQHRDLALEIFNGSFGNAGICLRVPRARGDDEGLDFELGEQRRRDGIVPDNGNVCAKQRYLLVEVPSERVEVVDHQNIELASEFFGEGSASGHGGGLGVVGRQLTV
jgi:hypothetical protein